MGQMVCIAPGIYPLLSSLDALKLETSIQQGTRENREWILSRESSG